MCGIALNGQVGYLWEEIGFWRRSQEKIYGKEGGFSYIDGKGVIWSVNGSPVIDGSFEAGFYLPILDQIFNEIGETGSFVAFCLGCKVVNIYNIWYLMLGGI